MFFWRNRVGIQSGPSRDPVGTQSGPNRAPIFAFLGTAFGQSGSSRDPVGHQFSNFWHHVWTCREAAKITEKHAKTTAKMLFFMNLAASRHWCPTGSRLDPDWIPTGQKRCPKMQKLVPDWIPTGSRLAKSGAQKCKNWCPTGSRRDPDWIHRLARTHSRTYFSLPRPTLAPIFLFRAPAVHQYPPPSCTKTVKAVLSQTGVLQVQSLISIWFHVFFC